ERKEKRTSQLPEKDAHKDDGGELQDRLDHDQTRLRGVEALRGRARNVSQKQSRAKVHLTEPGFVAVRGLRPTRTSAWKAATVCRGCALVHYSRWFLRSPPSPRSRRQFACYEFFPCHWFCVP